MADAVTADASDSLRVNRRLAFGRWVRRTHGWFGLWGALPDQQQSSTQVALPGAQPQTAEEMAVWLQQTLKLDRPASNIRVERARPVPWAERGGEGKPAMQPERWSFNL